ncbi:hypothetical protein RJ640_003821 [Escallonia rubra]|uniref:Uncharacterized protein n=1 Tax=Escallonia rubra TaxID=112253 RepID=A0AA88RJ23_9ASTE|nr:hypothetical protein RJ640_003821 [Escallonia rubra]
MEPGNKFEQMFDFLCIVVWDDDDQICGGEDLDRSSQGSGCKFVLDDFDDHWQVVQFTNIFFKGIQAKRVVYFMVQWEENGTLDYLLTILILPVALAANKVWSRPVLTDK